MNLGKNISNNFLDEEFISMVHNLSYVKNRVWRRISENKQQVEDIVKYQIGYIIRESTDLFLETTNVNYFLNEVES